MAKFELRVEFAGLCLYVDPRSGPSGPDSKVTILMPDARKTADPVHVDGAKGAAHVGYVRFDLANVFAALGVPESWADPGVVDEGSGSPPNEIVHRFDFEELKFGLPDLPMNSAKRAIKGDFKVPNFDKFTDRIRPIKAALGDVLPSPSPFLMRTVIE